MKADKEAQEVISRRRAEEAQRQHLLQRMGNGTPGQPAVRNTLRILRTLTSTVCRVRHKSQWLRVRRRGKHKRRGNLHPSQHKTTMPRGLN